MLEFKEGDVVVIVRHLLDSSDNYVLGDIATIIEIDSEDEVYQYHLAATESNSSWWVAEGCLDFAEKENE